MIHKRHLLATVRPFVVVAIAVATAIGVYAATGYDAGEVLGGIIDGSVGSPVAVVQSLRWSVPLLLIAVGVAVAFRAGYFNVGAQGQMYLGSIGALVVGVALDGAPRVLVVPLALMAGVLLGAVWSLIPGLLRLHFGADEVVTSLMLNFVAILLLQWVASGPLKSDAGSGQAAVSVPIAPEYRISTSTGVSPTILIVCGLVVVMVYLFSQHTRTGLEVRIVGRNAVMARWQGVNANGLGALVFAISGATAGLAGAIEVLGPAGMVRASYSPQVGFMAVVVALVGGLGVLGVLLAALFFGALRAATLYLPVVSDIPQSGIELISGLVALLITISATPTLRASWWRRKNAMQRQREKPPEPPPVLAENVSSTPTGQGTTCSDF
jgi:ABC-type uncharacterized transport system permease subunit